MLTISLVTIKSQIASEIEESKKKNSMWINPFRDKKFSLAHINIRQQLLEELNSLTFSSAKQNATEEDQKKIEDENKKKILEVFDRAIDSSKRLCGDGKKGKDQHDLLIAQRVSINDSEKILVKSIGPNVDIDRSRDPEPGDHGNQFIKNQDL